MERLNILQEADQLTSGDRQRDYDHPLPNHERIAELWETYLFCKYRRHTKITAEDAAWMMILLKCARDMNSPKRDNLTDTAGYARCLEKIRDEREHSIYRKQ